MFFFVSKKKKTKKYDIFPHFQEIFFFFRKNPALGYKKIHEFWGETHEKPLVQKTNCQRYTGIIKVTIYLAKKGQY